MIKLSVVFKENERDSSCRMLRVFYLLKMILLLKMCFEINMKTLSPCGHNDIGPL